MGEVEAEIWLFLLYGKLWRNSRIYSVLWKFYIYIYIYFNDIVYLNSKWHSSIVGDIESMPFIEALGQFSYRVGNVFHASDLPVYWLMLLSNLLLGLLQWRLRNLLWPHCLLLQALATSVWFMSAWCLFSMLLVNRYTSRHVSSGLHCVCLSEKNKIYWKNWSS